MRKLLIAALAAPGGGCYIGFAATWKRKRERAERGAAVRKGRESGAVRSSSESPFGLIPKIFQGKATRCNGRLR